MGARYTEQVSLKLTKEMWDRVREEAEKLELVPSQWMRMVLAERLRKEKE